MQRVMTSARGACLPDPPLSASIVCCVLPLLLWHARCRAARGCAGRGALRPTELATRCVAASCQHAALHGRGLTLLRRVLRAATLCAAAQRRRSGLLRAARPSCPPCPPPPRAASSRRPPSRARHAVRAAAAGEQAAWEDEFALQARPRQIASPQERLATLLLSHRAAAPRQRLMAWHGATGRRSGAISASASRREETDSACVSLPLSFARTRRGRAPRRCAPSSATAGGR